MPIKGQTDIESMQEKVIDLNVSYRLWKGEEKQNLTDKDGNPRLDDFGTQKKGSGKDLDELFRFSGSDRAVEQFKKHYGTLNPRSVNIFLPYAAIADCFPTWMEEYTGGSFQKRCDGERIVERKVRKSYMVGRKEAFTWMKEQVDEPCTRIEKGLDVCPDCGKNGNGRLFFYVKELYADGFGSTKCGMMSLRSPHDFSSLMSSLRQLHRRYESLHCSTFPSPMTFGYIPYVLTREKKQIMKAVNGVQVRSDHWIVTISEDPEWLKYLQLWQQHQEIELLRSNPEARSLLLPSLGVKAISPKTYDVDAEIVTDLPALPSIDNG